MQRQILLLLLSVTFSHIHPMSTVTNFIDYMKNGQRSNEDLAIQQVQAVMSATTENFDKNICSIVKEYCQDWEEFVPEDQRPKWVQKTTEIKLKSGMKGYTFTEKNINNATTVLDVKRSLKENEGIPVDCIVMKAMSSKPYTFGYVQQASDVLPDNARIKVMMHKYNTAQFKFFLIIRNNNNNNN